MRHAILLFLAVLALSSSGAAQAPGRNDPWKREVRRALDSATALVAGGVALDGGDRVGMLSEGESVAISVPLQAGMSYIVIAVCDRDCGRLELRVTDPRRYELDADRSNTRQPVLRVVPAVAGVHRFGISMAECHVNPCRFGVMLLRLPAPRTPRALSGMALISRHERSSPPSGLLAGPPLDLRPRRRDA